MNEEELIRLKKLLRLNEVEDQGSLELSHDDYLKANAQNQIYCKIPKRAINIFYTMPNPFWKKALLQILLVCFWGLLNGGAVYAFKGRFILGIGLIIGGHYHENIFYIICSI